MSIPGPVFKKNHSPLDYQFLCTWGVSLASTNPVFTISLAGAAEVVTWGNIYATGTMGFEMTFSDNILTNTYRTIINVPSAWSAGYDSGPIAGFIGSGYIRAYMAGAVLTVDTACNWTFSFTSLTFYVKYGSAPEITILTIGAQTMSGISYDERLNLCLGIPSLTGADSIGGPPTVCPGSGASSNSWSASSTFLGGYEYLVGSTWTQDPCQVDTTTTPGSCACFANVDMLSGTSSYAMGAESTINGSYTVGSNYTISCPGCTPSTATVYDVSYTFDYETSNISIQSTSAVVGPQLITTTWACDNNGTITNGGNGGVLTTPASTTCASARSVESDAGKATCAVKPIPFCVFPATCLYPATNYCTFSATVDLTWPDFPPCGSSSTALAYDVSSYIRHGSLWADSGTGHLIMGFANNYNPRSISVVDTGITGTEGWIAWQDHQPCSLDGLLYVDGSGHLLLAQTPDEGVTFNSPITISTTLVSGGGFGYVEDANFVRHFWQQTGSGPYTIQYKILDAQFNVVSNWANTNITNSAKGLIVGRRTTKTGGQMVLSLLYLVGTDLMFATSNGDGTFSSPITISTTLVSGGGYTFWEDVNFTRHFFQQVGTGTIQYKQLDSQGNVIVNWTNTTITNSDLGSIACGRATASGGQLTLELLYTVGGIITCEVSNGDTNFS